MAFAVDCAVSFVSGDRDDWTATFSAGVEFGYGNVHVAVRFVFKRDRDLGSPNDDYGSLTISYLFLPGCPRAFVTSGPARGYGTRLRHGGRTPQAWSATSA